MKNDVNNRENSEGHKENVFIIFVIFIKTKIILKFKLLKKRMGRVPKTRIKQ